MFFFNDTATTEIYTLSLHDALPILTNRAAQANRSPDHRRTHLPRRRRHTASAGPVAPAATPPCPERPHHRRPADRKSTRLNSSHANISYAVFCLKKKKTRDTNTTKL